MEFLNNGGSFGPSPQGTREERVADTGGGAKDKKLSLTQLEIISKMISNNSNKAKRKRPKFIRKVTCQVCGDVANDHMHYGAITCYSCRAFFRRGVHCQAPYFCTHNQACVVDKKTRRNCQYCRFQKCLSIGMKATWVLTEEDKFEKKEKAIIKKIMTKAKKSNKMGTGVVLPEPIRTTELEGKVSQLLQGATTTTTTTVNSSSSSTLTTKLPSPKTEPESPQPPRPTSTASSSNEEKRWFNQEPPLTSSGNTNAYNDYGNHNKATEQNYKHPSTTTAGNSHLPSVKPEDGGYQQQRNNDDDTSRLSDLLSDLVDPSPNNNTNVNTTTTRNFPANYPSSVSSNITSSLTSPLINGFNGPQHSYHSMQPSASQTSSYNSGGDGGGPYPAAPWSTMNNHYIQNGSSTFSSGGGGVSGTPPEAKTEWPLSTIPTSSQPYAMQSSPPAMVHNWQQQFDEAAKAELERMRSYSGGGSGNERAPSVASVRSPFLMDFETSSASSGGGSDQELETIKRSAHSVDYSLCELDRIVDRMIGTSSAISSGNQQQMARQLMAIGTVAANAVGLAGGGQGTAAVSIPAPVPMLQVQSRVPVLKAMPFTSEEDGLVRGMLDLEYQTTEKIPIPGHTLRSIMNAAQTGKPLPLQASIDGYTVCMQRIIQFAQSIELFTTFCSEDQRAMLMTNTEMLVTIRSARMLRPGGNLQDQIAVILGKQKGETSATAVDQTKRIHYRQIFSNPWCSSEEVEKRFYQLMCNIFDLRMDKCTIVLLSVMALFCPHHIDLKEQERAVKIQEFFSQMLFRYLKQATGAVNAAHMLPKYMSILSDLEEMSRIMSNNRLQV